MVLHCRQEHSLGKEVFVSALCQFVPIISRTHRLILISKMVATESAYDCIVAFQYYFGITNNFFMRLFGSRIFTYGLMKINNNNNKADSITMLPRSFA